MTESEPKIECVVFDWDGTAVDSYPFFREVELSLMDRHGVALPDGLYEDAAGRTFHDFMSNEGLNHYPDLDLATLLKEYDHMISSSYSDSVRLAEGFKEFLIDLNNAGIRTAIASNNLSSLVKRAAVRLEVDKLLPGIVCIDHVPAAKPDPAMVKRAIELIKGAPERTLFVGDSMVDVGAARNAGVRNFAGITHRSNRHIAQRFHFSEGVTRGLAYEDFGQISNHLFKTCL